MLPGGGKAGTKSCILNLVFSQAASSVARILVVILRYCQFGGPPITTDNSACWVATEKFELSSMPDNSRDLQVRRCRKVKSSLSFAR